MHLSPRELDKLVIHQVGSLAQKRLARGLRLNHTEACALIASVILELVRDGTHSVASLMDLGRRILGRRHVLDSVRHTLAEIQVEGTFRDGTKLITIHDPICSEAGDIKLALYGSFLPLPDESVSFPAVAFDADGSAGPGAVLLHADKSSIILNEGRKRYALEVVNDGDRPIQIGSHYHFIETNRELRFDRGLSYGKRLDIPCSLSLFCNIIIFLTEVITAGTAVRFEPGEKKIVTLTDIAGSRYISGGNGLATGKYDMSLLSQILKNVQAKGFKHQMQTSHFAEPSPYSMPRKAYVMAYGPTTGDKIRLGDSSLYAEIEKDFCSYGDEAIFGGGKSIREGMGQCTDILERNALDVVITSVVVIDYTGIYKADIGVKNGLISAIGKAGNPDVMSGVTPGMVIGAATEVLSGEGRIITAGGIDTHIHFICPQLWVEALSSGVTTLIGGGTGPNTGTCATTCTPGSRHIRFMLQATDDIPLNFGFTGKGNCSSAEPLVEQINAGAIGLKLHEDWGTSPQAIDTCLNVCELMDVQVTIHTDTLNESGFVEDSCAAFKNRTVHAYHSEGAGGGHAPDIIKVCGTSNVIPSSTNPTRPFTKNTIDEHLDMLLVCHHLDKNIPEDVAFAESRIRGETIAAEDVLHDLGAISIISSDSQAMGRIGEVISRTWQTADKMKQQRGALHVAADDLADNFRIKRYIAKYTVNPAIAHGISHIVGSIEVGKLADLVLWEPAFFGTKADKILKGGSIVWSQMGDANASIPTPQPIIGRPMFAAYPSAFQGRDTSDATQQPLALSFVSQTSIENSIATRFSLKKRVEAVRNCRNIGKRDMKLNDFLPDIQVDPETYRVTVDGIHATVEPADSVPLSRGYYIF